MKTRIFFALVALCCYSCVPNYYIPKIKDGKLEGVLPVMDGRVRYVAEKSITGATPEKVFRQVRRWAALHVNDPSVVFGLGDNKLYDVVSSYALPSYLIAPNRNAFQYVTPRVNFALIVECYEGGYRLTFGNFRREQSVGEAVGKDSRWLPLEGTAQTSRAQYISHLERIEKDVFEAMESLGKFVSDNI